MPILRNNQRTVKVEILKLLVHDDLLDHLSILGSRGLRDL